VRDARGLRRVFDGSGYYVTMVRYKHDLRQSMRTYFEAERPTINKEAGS
jgi:uncharacterized protein